MKNTPRNLEKSNRMLLFLYLQNMTIKHFFCASFFAAFVIPVFAADSPVRFLPDPYQLGEMQQGEVRHVVLRGANVTNKDIPLETVMSQGTGVENLKFPMTIGANKTITIELDLNSAYKEGPFTQTIVLIGKNGTNYTTSLEGVVNAPVFFSEKMFDAGYYSKGETREWTFYAWNTDKITSLELSLDSAGSPDFSASFKAVQLNIDKLDQIKEGGKIPGLKITLKTKGLDRSKTPATQKSLNRIVGFKSKNHPKATPEVLIVGYWK